MDLRKVTTEQLQKEIGSLTAKVTQRENEIKELSVRLGIEPTIEAIKEKAKQLNDEKVKLEAELEEIISEIESLESSEDGNSSEQVETSHDQFNEFD